MSSACRRSARTWSTARSSSGSSPPATSCITVTSSRSCTPRRPTSRSRVFDDGVIGELLVPVGQEVEVGTPLATVLADVEVDAPRRPHRRTGRRRSPRTRHRSPLPCRRCSGSRADRRSRPVSRRALTPRARDSPPQRGLDLAQISATGGVVTGADVERVTHTAASDSRGSARGDAPRDRSSDEPVPTATSRTTTCCITRRFPTHSRGSKRRTHNVGARNASFPVALFCRAVVRRARAGSRSQRLLGRRRLPAERPRTPRLRGRRCAVVV